MFAVIVGDMSLDKPADRQRVFDLIDELQRKYADLVIVSAGCDRGIGRFVKERCIKGKRDVGFIEYAVYPWASMSSVRLAQVYIAKNATLVEVGEEFHVFVSAGREHGHIQDLVERVRSAKHQPPFTIYKESVS